MSGLTDFMTSGPRALPTFSEQLSNTTCFGTPSTLCSQQKRHFDADELHRLHSASQDYPALPSQKP